MIESSEFKYAKTGPFVIEKVISDDPNFLKIQFDDISPKTGQKSVRKMSKQGNWPMYLVEMLSEKATKLLNQKVIVKTSQTTKPWDTTEWLCDVETIKNYAIKSSVGSKSLAADGKSNLSKTLAFTGQTSLIDYSLSQSEFKQEVDYEDFWKSLEKQFESSWSAKNARIISEDTRRIRISGPNNLTKRNGFRVLVWNKLNVFGFEYYIVLKVDRKLDEDEFPNKKLIEKIKDEIESVYEGKNLEELIEKATKEDIGADHDIELETPIEIEVNDQKIYLNCPFSEKDECKALGGKWDPGLKKWYIPGGISPEKFSKWMS